MAQISHLTYFVLFTIMGSENFQQSEEIMDEWNPKKADLIEEVRPYAKTAYFLFTLGRLILMLISIKKLSITRLYFYYELLNVVIDQFFPRNVDVSTATLIHLYY